MTFGGVSSVAATSLSDIVCGFQIPPYRAETTSDPISSFVWRYLGVYAELRGRRYRKPQSPPFGNGGDGVMMGFPAFPALSAALTQRSTAGPKPRELAQAAVATRAQKCVLRNTVQPAATLCVVGLQPKVAIL